MPKKFSSAFMIKKAGRRSFQLVKRNRLSRAIHQLISQVNSSLEMIENRQALESVIDRLLQVDEFASQEAPISPSESPDLDLKIALLSFLLEELRYERDHEG